MKLAIWILWPSFLVGALANAVFFTLFDPVHLHVYWDTASTGVLAAYTIGFFAFWVIAACSSAFTCFLQRSSEHVNRLHCPVPNKERPTDCRTPDTL